ncbi:hypothetical protein VP01_2269g2 [Puccinia sorghi]|uniref:Uncharacterized protein n=1 Tax=Puccinia sorghi TaxID=27349 RepID=A0A0L6V8F2_9BASI|nr:hypothetical protein VP01_2269g2 [Puccinia sorghi]
MFSVFISSLSPLLHSIFIIKIRIALSLFPSHCGKKISLSSFFSLCQISYIVFLSRLVILRCINLPKAMGHIFNNLSAHLWECKGEPEVLFFLLKINSMCATLLKKKKNQQDVDLMNDSMCEYFLLRKQYKRSQSKTITEQKKVTLVLCIFYSLFSFLFFSWPFLPLPWPFLLCKSIKVKEKYHNGLGLLISKFKKSTHLASLFSHSIIEPFKSFGIMDSSMIQVIVLTCSMLQPCCHPNSTFCTVAVQQSLVESLLEKGWRNSRSFTGLSACQIQAVEQVFVAVPGSAFIFPHMQNPQIFLKDQILQPKYPLATSYKICSTPLEHQLLSMDTSTLPISVIQDNHNSSPSVTGKSGGLIWCIFTAGAYYILSSLSYLYTYISYTLFLTFKCEMHTIRHLMHHVRISSHCFHFPHQIQISVHLTHPISTLLDLSVCSSHMLMSSYASTNIINSTPAVTLSVSFFTEIYFISHSPHCSPQHVMSPSFLLQFALFTFASVLSKEVSHARWKQGERFRL